MRTVTFSKNAPPFNAGETAGVPDDLARGYVREGTAVYADGKPEDKGPRVGDQVVGDQSGKRERHAAVDAGGVPLGGEAPGSMPEDTTTLKSDTLAGGKSIKK